jgi:hypothetical protein
MVDVGRIHSSKHRSRRELYLRGYLGEYLGNLYQKNTSVVCIKKSYEMAGINQSNRLIVVMIC